MIPISLSRNPDLKHHLLQGSAWLVQSANGEKTAALSYAAFEFRLAIERLGVQYWRELLGKPFEEKDLLDIHSFKKIERRIYDLAGHQKEINGHFEFMKIVLALLKINAKLATPNLGKLSGYWHECSELCHVGGSLASNDIQVMSIYFSKLQEIEAFLSELVNGLVTWPRIADSSFNQLRSEFIAGRANEKDIELYFTEYGAWAKVEFPDGRPPQFIGEAIPPKKTEEDAG